MKILFLIFLLLIYPIPSFSQMTLHGNIKLNGNISNTLFPPSIFDMTNAANYFDVMGTVAESGYLQTNPYARGVFSTTATGATILGYSNYNSGGDFGGLGVRVNGADTQYLKFTANGFQTFNVTFPVGVKTIEVVSGFQQFHAPMQGQFVVTVTFLGDLSPSLALPVNASRLVVFGDSISLGAFVTNPPFLAWPRLITNYWEAQGTAGSVTSYGAGAASMVEYCSNSTTCQTLANTLTSQFSGITNKSIWIQMSHNDWADNTRSASVFGTNYSLLLADIHSNDATIHVYAQTAITAINETVPNTFGNTLPDYRTAITASCNAVSTYCTTIDGTTILSYPSDYDSDKIHPTTAAQTKYATFVQTALGI